MESKRGKRIGLRRELGGRMKGGRVTREKSEEK